MVLSDLPSFAANSFGVTDGASLRICKIASSSKVHTKVQFLHFGDFGDGIVFDDSSFHCAGFKRLSRAPAC